MGRPRAGLTGTCSAGARPSPGRRSVDRAVSVGVSSGANSEGAEMAEQGSDRGADPEAGSAAGAAVERIRSALIDIVGYVIEARKAHAAYAVFRRIEGFASQGFERDDVYESFLGTAMVLAAMGGRSSTSAGRDGAEALAWVRENLGAWPSAAAARAGAPLGIPPSADGTGPDLKDVQDDLREHMLPAVIWLTAGIVAVAGAGNDEWLRRVSDG